MVDSSPMATVARVFNVVGFAGSLRRGSYNRALLRAATDSRHLRFTLWFTSWTASRCTTAMSRRLVSRRAWCNFATPYGKRMDC